MLYFLYLHYPKIHHSIKESVFDKYDDFSQEYFGNKEENLRNYDEYLKEAAEVINEIIDDNQAPWGNDLGKKFDKILPYGLKIQVKEQKVFCEEISCEKIKSIFNETFSEENLKKYYFNYNSY